MHFRMWLVNKMFSQRGPFDTSVHIFTLSSPSGLEGTF